MARHPLQRLASPSRTISLLIHVAGLASFSASFKWLSQWAHPIAESYGGHFQFLTNIGLILATLTFAAGLASDLTLSSRLFRIKNRLSVCAAPLEVLVSILYWGIRSIDKTLIIPPDFELPWMPDVGFHLMPAVMLSLDLILLSPPWTVTAYAAMAISMSIAFLYWGWVEFCFSKNGWYPYPLFGLLSTAERVLLFTFSAILMAASTFMLKWIYGRVNGLETAMKEAHRPLKEARED